MKDPIHGRFSGLFDKIFSEVLKMALEDVTKKKFF